MSEYDFDLFIVGGGSGGVRAARVASSLGARVGLAEERYFGGTCVNVGCVPKKLFSYAAHYADDFSDSHGFGWRVPETSFDWATLKKNKDSEINRLEGIYRSILENSRVTVYEDRARISGPHSLRIGNEEVSARYILLAVGAWPWTPTFEGSELAVTSNQIFAMETLPDRIAIIGGGYIAVEFASILSGLGSNVTLSYRGEKLLRGFDDEIRDFITRETGRKVTLKLLSEPERLLRNNKELRLYLNTGDEIACDMVLSATGRKPLTDDLGLEHVKVELDQQGAICVDEHFQTSEPSIYAVGDSIDRVALTPVALAEAQIVARALFSSENRPMDYRNVPSTVFCHPNVGTVGLTEQEARDEGLEIDIYSARVKQLRHTLSGRKEQSLLKLIVNTANDRVLGVHMVGPEAGELIQGFAVALNCGATKADFDNTIGIHPTLAEEFVTMRTMRKAHDQQD